MGEAKKRGRFEQRQAEAINRNAEAQRKMVEARKAVQVFSTNPRIGALLASALAIAAGNALK